MELNAYKSLGLASSVLVARQHKTKFMNITSLEWESLTLPVNLVASKNDR